MLGTELHPTHSSLRPRRALFPASFSPVLDRGGFLPPAAALLCPMKKLLLILALTVLPLAGTGCTKKFYKRITYAPPIQAGEPSQPLEEVTAKASGFAAKSEATNLEAQMTKTTDTNGVVQETRLLKAGRVIGQADPEAIKAGGGAIAEAAQGIGDAALKIKAPPGAPLPKAAPRETADPKPASPEAEDEPEPATEPET